VRSLPEADAELAQPPARIELWFSEPLEAGFSTARLLNSSGQELPSGAVIIDPANPAHMTLPLGSLEPGVYTVAWLTLSQVDGHEFAGSFPITVLPPGWEPPQPAEAAAGSAVVRTSTAAEALARWCWLLGSAVLFGVPFFQLAVAPAGRIAGRSDPGLNAGDLGLLAIWIAALAVTAGQVWQFGLQAARLGGASQLADLLLGTRLGALMLARQALVFSMLFASLLLLTQTARRAAAALCALAAITPIIGAVGCFTSARRL
jgi:methionine-rich copper-binding protein CopC